jgi:hypothetical protein
LVENEEDTFMNKPVDHTHDEAPKAPAGVHLPPLTPESPAAKPVAPAPVNTIARDDVVTMLHDIADRIVECHGNPQRMAILVADLRRHDGAVVPLPPVQTT